MYSIPKLLVKKNQRQVDMTLKKQTKKTNQNIKK